MTWSKTRLYLTSLFTLMLLAWLFYLVHGERTQPDQRRAEVLLQLQALDNALDLEVSLISSMGQQNYDEVVHLISQLNQQEYDPETAKLFLNLPTELTAKLKQYRRTLHQRTALIERLKTSAAIVRNGLNFMPMLLQSVSEDHLASLPQARNIVNTLYQYHIFRSSLDANEIKKSLTVLTDNGSGSIEELKLHITANLNTQTQLAQLIEEYKQIPNKAAFNQLYSAYLSYRNKVETQTEYLNSALIGLTATLVLLLTFLYLRLIRFHSLKDQAQKRLKDGVDNINEAFALFDGGNQLVLCNRTFSNYYPWVADLLIPGTSKAVLQTAIDQKCSYQKDSGSASRSLQILENGDCYLCSNSPTNEGGEVWVRVDMTDARSREQELRKLSRALEQNPAAVVITDINGLIEYINPKAEEISGYSLQEVLGERPSIFSSGDISPTNYQDMWRQMLDGKVWQGTFLNRRKNRQLYWEAATISAVRDPLGEITHFVAVKEDITERRSTEEQLRMNAAVFETTNEGIMITSPDTRIISVNPAFTEITGFTAEEVVGKTPQVFQAKRQTEINYKEMWKILEQNHSWSGEIWNQRRDGTTYPQWLSIAAVRNSDGVLEQYVAVFSDMSQRKADEEKIRQQANYDALTELPNRIMLKRELQQVLTHCKEQKTACALLFIDLDRFKAVNDTLGHSVGDNMLQQVSQRLASVIRENDFLARFGGDEFVIVLQDIAEPEDAAHRAKRVIDALRPPFQLAGRTLYIGASVGISCYPSDAENGEAMLRHADMAMYLAKDSGRNQHQFFNTKMREHIRNQTDLEQSMRHAIAHEEFELFYQPIYSCEESKVTAAEALIRWHHPERGLISPAEFIPLAEETGLIQPIGLWVFKQACEQLKEWKDQGIDNLAVSVNVSSSQRHLGFNAQVAKEIIAKAGADPTKIIFEITETMFLESSNEAISWLNQLKELGAKLAIDDFGTGYSSLSYLKQFPIDKLKIDRAFIRDLPDNAEDASLVNAIAAMSKSLGLELIAEGVETIEQFKYLEQLNCQNIQGFLLSKPIPADELPSAIRQIEATSFSEVPSDYII